MFVTWCSKPWRMWRSHWKNRSDWSNRRLSIVIVGMLTFAAAVPYLVINRFSEYMQRTAFNPEIPFDLEIPFVAWMVIPYLSLYLYYPAGAWLGHKSDVMWRQNIVFHQMMLLSCWMCFFVFLLFPVEIDLRHLVTNVDGTVWEPWIGAVHGVDKPWNAWPSLHVVQSSQIVLILRYWFPSSTRKVLILQTLLLICWALLIISTLTLKQHYVWDAITGLLFTGITWVYWMKPCLDRLETKEFQDKFDAVMAED